MFGSIGVPELIILGVIAFIGYGVYQGFTGKTPTTQTVTAPAAVGIEQMTTTTPTTAGLKRCLYCAEEIQAAAIVCKHCGRALAAGVPGVPPTASAPSLGVAAVLS